MILKYGRIFRTQYLALKIELKELLFSTPQMYEISR